MKKMPLVKTVTTCIFLYCGAFLVACGLPPVASAQMRTIRVVSYNIEDDISGATTPLPGLIAPSSGGSITNGGVLEGIGEEVLGSDTNQPIDVLTLQETTSNPITVAPIVSGLNVFYSSRTNPAGYAMSPYQATDDGGEADGGGPNAMVYNTNTLQLIASVGVGSPSSGSEPRQIVRYEFAPAGATPTTNNEFYVYCEHYKSGSTSGDISVRNAEAQIVRTDVATLPSNARVLFTGDFNTGDASEAMYQTLVAAGVNQAFDVYNPTGSSSSNFDSSGSIYALTESATNFRYRDDYQMMTSNVLFGVTGGLTYNPGTYHPFANNGSLSYDGNVSSGNTSLNSDLNTNGVGITASQLYSYLSTASDHLPVVADYTIPIPVQSTPRSIQNVFIILEENQNWASISGNAAAPYINNGLLPKSSYALQYYNPPGLHPSLPNYLWLEAGTNFGVTADGDPSSYSQTSTNHLVTLLKNAGVSWTSYQEDISGSVCPLTEVAQYAPKHNPMVFFDDVTNTNTTGSAYCIANVRPYTELVGDLHSNVVTRYNFITPNLCDDMHGNTGCLTGNALITQGDTWLSNTVATIVGSQAYSNNGAIFVTWDEGEGGDGPIGMIVLSPLAKGGGYSNSVHYTHSSTLLTMQEIFNVGPSLGDATNATDLSDLFVFGAKLAVSPLSSLSSTGIIGGPFSPGSQTYTLSNTGGVAMVWSVTNAVNWLTLSATNGTLSVGVTTNITVSINNNANSLAGGSYSDSVVFVTSNGSGIVALPVSLTVLNPFGQLSVSPSGGFTTGGPPGGPFTPVSLTYTVSNTGAASVNWAANNSANWLTLSPTSGTLGIDASINVTATINTNANGLAIGGYSDTIEFTNTSTGAGSTTRTVNLNVSNFGFYDDFSTFSSGNLVGQQSWTQLGATAGTPLQITNGQAAFPGGLTANNQTAYKNFKLTNEAVFYGLTLTVTNAPNTNGVPYFAALYTGTNGGGTAEFRLAAESPNAAKTNYVLGVRITPAATDPFTFGTAGLSYGSQCRVIVQAVAGGSNVVLYVNPTSGNILSQTQYATNFITSGAPTSIGSFAISQLDSGTIPSAGGLIGKVVVGDNFGTVYNDLLGPPVASFTASPTNGFTPLTVNFTDTSSGSITGWAWAFGDGNTSTNQSPSNIYVNPGAYTVQEIVSGSGGFSTNTQANYITASMLPPPVASFTGSPTNGVTPLSVTFTDMSSGTITNWSWSFGDGGTTNVTTNTVLYTYNATGVYSVAEIVSGPGGSSTNTQANYITVLTPPPVASFTANPISGPAPLNVNFTDSSSGSITGWAWMFGDGNTSTSQNPSDTYANPGSYTVQEIVSGPGGSGTDTLVNAISVYDPFAWWQLTYFGSTNNPNAAAGADSTGAGMSNTNKFLVGFSPTNSAAYLHVISIVEQTMTGNVNVVVTYLGPNGDNTYVPGVASRTNVLDYITGGSYTNGGWQDTGQTNILSGGNGSGIVTNMVDTAIPDISTNRFYRVRVLLP